MRFTNAGLTPIKAAARKLDSERVSRSSRRSFQSIVILEVDEEWIGVK